MTDDEKVKIHKMVENQISICRHKMELNRQEKEYLNANLELLVLLRTEYSRFVCTTCQGKGEVTVWDGGDSHFMKCRQCAGTGKL